MIMRTMIAVTMVVFAITVTYAGEPAKPILRPEVEKAVLAEDWGMVAELIGEVAPDATVVQRFVMGHACLALNRNNDSVLLFLTASGPDDLKNWNKWAATFKQSHHDSAIAYYFVGDSLARLEQYDQAIASFSTGLNAQSNHVLLLNAQGVCYARTGKLAESRKFFDAAIKASGGKFADAHANLGAYWIERSEAPEGANKAFSVAIDHSIGFALALIGRGAVKLVVGESSSFEDFDQAMAQGDFFKSLVALQLIEHGLRGAGASADEAALEIADLGTTLKRDYRKDDLVKSATFWGAVAETFRNDQRWGGFGKAIGNFAGNRMVDKFTAINDAYGSRALNESINANNITRRVGPGEITRVGSYNRDIRGAEKAVADTSGLIGLGATTVAFKVPSGQAKIIAGGIAVGSKGVELGAKKAHDWSTQHNNTLKALDPRWTQRRSTGFTSPSHEAEVGGADLALKRVIWDEGDWPFKALYGLAYGMVSSNEKQNVDVKNKPEK